jgi:outer membrane protein OmpA-like peptidoglycan-associated protein
MKKALIFSFAAFINHSNAQNLVLNPGFEQSIAGNGNISTLELCLDWANPTAASPDYFNTQTENDLPGGLHPKYWWGTQNPAGGKAYSGFIAYRLHNDKKSCEYLEARFTEPLIKDEFYTIGFYLSLAECSSISLKTLGAYLSRDSVYMKTIFMLKYKPQVNFTITANDTANWVKITAQYKAAGGEKFMVLGCFDPEGRISFNKEKPAKYIRGARDEAYYFMDDVSVSPVKKGMHSETRKDTVFATTAGGPITDETMPLAPGASIVLENLFFESGQSVILETSFPELERLCRWLNLHPDRNIMINGYTDHTGSAQKNQGLSQERAKAVFDYLVNKNIDSTRLKWKGFGAENPRATNETGAGRQKNRRVEIIFL